MDKSEDNIYTISEDGKIIGYGRKRIDKITNALAAYITVASGVFLGSRITGLYQTYSTQAGLPLYLTSKSLGINEIDGQITYGENWTDDQSLVAVSGIKRAEVNYTDDMPVNLVNAFQIANQKELIQPVSGVPTVTRRNLRLGLIGERSLTLTGYVDQAVRRAAAYIPVIGGIDTFLSDCQYNWSSGSNQFDFSCEWQNFSGGSYFDDINNLNLL